MHTTHQGSGTADDDGTPPATGPGTFIRVWWRGGASNDFDMEEGRDIRTRHAAYQGGDTDDTRNLMVATDVYGTELQFHIAEVRLIAVSTREARAAYFRRVAAFDAEEAELKADAGLPSWEQP